MPLMAAPWFPVLISDPVCGELVDMKLTQFKAEFGGKNYGFCSKKCLDEFMTDTSKYTGKTMR